MAELDQPGQEGTVPHGFQEAPPTVIRAGQQESGLQELDQLGQQGFGTNNGARTIQLPNGTRYAIPARNPIHDEMLAQRLEGKPWGQINNALQGVADPTELHSRLHSMARRNLALSTDNGPMTTQLPGDERG